MMGPVSQSATAASKYYYEKDPIYEKNNSRWLGGGCESLGLEVGAVVLKDDFNNIIRGNDLSRRANCSGYLFRGRANRTSRRC